MHFTASTWIGGLVLAGTAGALLLWTVILGSTNPLHIPTTSTLAWPLACTSSGCVTTKALAQHYETQVTFAQAAQQPVPHLQQVFTTLVRQHLVGDADPTLAISLADATAYREKVLQLTSEETTKAYTQLSLPEYDENIIMPYLQQEALMQRLQIASVSDLYKKLSGEHRVFVLSRDLIWDTDTSEVVRRD